MSDCCEFETGWVSFCLSGRGKFAELMPQTPEWTKTRAFCKMTDGVDGMNPKYLGRLITELDRRSFLSNSDFLPKSRYPGHKNRVWDMNLTPGEMELLIDGLSDDVAFIWVLIHLGIRTNPPPMPDWSPTPSDLQEAFASLKKLTDLGLIRVGRIEYVDGGPPGRMAPVRHIAEDMNTVVSRVETAVGTARVPDDWAYSCWVVNTDNGDVVASRSLDRQNPG